MIVWVNFLVATCKQGKQNQSHNFECFLQFELVDTGDITDHIWSAQDWEITSELNVAWVPIESFHLTWVLQ